MRRGFRSRKNAVWHRLRERHSFRGSRTERGYAWALYERFMRRFHPKTIWLAGHVQVAEYAASALLRQSGYDVRDTNTDPERRAVIRAVGQRVTSSLITGRFLRDHLYRPAEHLGAPFAWEMGMASKLTRSIENLEATT